MPLDDKSVFAAVLGVGAPWVVTDVQVGGPDRIVTVRVEHATPPARFWMRREAPPIRERLRWEHVSIAGQRCQVVLGLRDGEQVPSANWVGEENTGFSRALSRLVLDMLLAGATVEQLSRLLQLPYAELWRYKFRLDQGGTKAVGAAPAMSAAAPTDAAGSPRLPSAAAGASATKPGGLPAEDHPVWLELLHGRLPLDVKALSLKLLLTKVQGDARRHGDADLHRQAAQGLHRYFSKHGAMLLYELSQLEAAAARAAAAQARASAAAAPLGRGEGLPDASDPVWLALINGECQIEVRTLSLKLLLTKLRGQIGNVRDDDVRMLKLVELHRFFERHRTMLGHEITQIQHWKH